MKKVLSYPSQKIRCPSPFTNELLADDFHGIPIIKPIFSKARNGFYGTIKHQSFLIQLSLLIHNNFPKLGESLSLKDRVFIKNAMPIYARHTSRIKQCSFMNLSFLGAYKKIEKRSDVFTLQTLDYFLYKYLTQDDRSILVMSYQKQTYSIGVSQFRLIEFDDALQFFNVKTFKSNRRSEWVLAIRSSIINWALPDVDLANVNLQLMWLKPCRVFSEKVPGWKNGQRARHCLGIPKLHSI